MSGSVGRVPVNPPGMKNVDTEPVARPSRLTTLRSIRMVSECPAARPPNALHPMAGGVAGKLDAPHPDGFPTSVVPCGSRTPNPNQGVMTPACGGAAFGPRFLMPTLMVTTEPTRALTDAPIAARS